MSIRAFRGGAEAQTVTSLSQSDFVQLYDATTGQPKKATVAKVTVAPSATPGTVEASEVVVVDSNKDVTGFRNVTATGAVSAGSYVTDSVTLSNIKWVDVTVTAAALDASSQTGTVTVAAAATGDQYKIRNVILVGGGTSFGAGGDRTVDLTDGTTIWTTIANADLESAPSASLMWGNAKVPFLTGTSGTASAAGAAIVFKYGTGSSAHTTGSIKFAVQLEKVA